MGLVLPTVSVTPGPTYATENNTAFTTVDSHDHSTGKGVQITPAGINITSDLEFNSNDATELRTTRFDSQSAALATGSDVGCFYNVNGAPTWNDNGGSSSRLVNVSFPMVIGDIPYASSTTAFGRLGIGTTGQILKVVGGLPSWGASSSNLNVVTKTASGTTFSYTILSTDDVILCDDTTATSSFTLTLPVSTGSGKTYLIKKVDSVNTNVITIARATTDVIVDAGSSVTSTTVNTQGEELTLLDATSGTWQVLNRRIPSIWIAYTPTVTDNSNTTSNGAFWRRVGDSVEVEGSIAWTGGGSGSTWTVTIPNSSSWTIDTAKLNVSGGTNENSFQSLGPFHWFDASTTYRIGNTVYSSTTTVRFPYQAATAGVLGTDFANGDAIKYRFTIPITGLKG